MKARELNHLKYHNQQEMSMLEDRLSKAIYEKSRI